ncbi:MAG: AEC family transporter [Gammaproteobacteria bacterium]|jgi:malonate transporter|nr:AEC family transporter [Gammaproteobacteria bacterium]|tara:strand:+ start:2192 stop:3109 length:918 start_codon:yes stop_codon:yes gene_type:complete
MILSALTPIFAIILLGFLISRTPISSQAVWSELERLTYYIFLPALLVLRLSASNFDLQDIGNISEAIGLALFLITVLVLVLRKLVSSDSASLSSIYQGSIRFNTYIGLACIDVLYGDRGLTTAALCLAIYIPLVNVLCVVSLTGGGEGGTKRISRIINSVATNPLVLACVTGIAISYTGFNIPSLAESVIEILSQPALPIGLLAVGAGIRFVSLGEQSWQLLVAAINKLAVFPGLVLAACLLFETPNSIAVILLLLTALPAPPSAYILARQLGGNESLMANIITIQTVAAFFVIPVWIEFANRHL